MPYLVIAAVDGMDESGYYQRISVLEIPSGLEKALSLIKLEKCKWRCYKIHGQEYKPSDIIDKMPENAEEVNELVSP